jgi:hypothetical protein
MPADSCPMPPRCSPLLSEHLSYLDYLAVQDEALVRMDAEAAAIVQRCHRCLIDLALLRARCRR